MRFSSSQLLIVTLFGLAILAAVAFLDRSFIPVLVSVVISVISIFIHLAGGETSAANVIKGVNIGIPLQAPVSSPPAAPQGASSEKIPFGG